MEIIRKDINVPIGEELHIYFMGDVHKGSANHDKTSFNKAVKHIKDDPNPHKYVIGMGDYIDAINYHDRRFNPAEVDPEYKIEDLADLAQKQMEEFIAGIEPIKDRFIALLNGNHEEAYVKWNGFDAMKRLKHHLRVPRLGYVGMIRLGINRRNGKQRNGNADYYFDIDLNHGVGGGGFREGYPINKAWDVFRWSTGDVRAMGHVHALTHDIALFRNVVAYKGRLVARYLPTVIMVTGCFMVKEKEGTRGYFEPKPGKYSGIGMPMLKIRIGSEKYNCEMEVRELRF